MRPGLLVAATVLVVPLSAQVSVETGGGVARLTNYSGGAFSSFRGMVHQDYSGLQLSFMNNTVDHRGLGTAYRTELSLRAPLTLGEWQLSVGPQIQLARGVENPSTRTLGVGVAFARNVSITQMTGRIDRGSAWYGKHHNEWTAGEIRFNSRFGSLQVGTSFRSLLMTDSIPRTDVFFDLRDPQRDTLYRERVAYTNDVAFNMGWGIGRISVDGRVGARFSSGIPTTSWWEGNFAVRVASSLAITLGSSKLPEDPLLRLHGGRFTALGLRLGGASGSTTSHIRVPADPLAVEVDRVSANKVTLRFAIPGARNTASISGEFSAWQPIALTRCDDGRWEARIEAIPGLYRMNIRVDGGVWSVPPGMRSVADDFDGVVGLLIVR